MHRRLILFLAAFLAVLLLAAWSLIYLDAQQIGPESFRAPDGRIVRIEQVTYGKTHSFSSSSSWMDKWRRILPAPLLRVLGSGSSGTFGLGEDALGVWLSFADPLTGKSLPPNGRYILESIDEHGCKTGSRNAMTTIDDGVQLICLALDTFPRERERVKLRLYDQKNEKELLGIFSVPNPARTPSRPWPAQPVVQATNDHLAASFGGWKNSISPLFDIWENGNPATNWFFEDVVLEDQQGNRSSQLCRFQPLWKVSANFFRILSGPFPGNSIVRLGNFQLSTSTGFIATNFTGQLNNAPFTVLGFGTPGKHTFSNGLYAASVPLAGPRAGGVSSSSYSQGGVTISTVDFPSDHPFLALRTPALKPVEKLFLRATDQDGNIFRGEFGGSGNWIAFYSFDLPSETKSVSIDLIVQQTLSFDFYVPPPGLDRALP